MKRWSFIGCAALILLAVAFPASAQTSPASSLSELPSLSQSGLTMTASPQYPAPGTAVNFTLHDTQDDLTVANIIWLVNGAQASSGVGQSSFQMTAGAAGSESTVSVHVTTHTGAVLTQSATIVPEGVDLLWQAHSYVPPFYKGKALFPYQGSITLTALPTFALTNPQNAVYDWQLEDEASPGISGAGKDTISLTGSILLQPITVSVTVHSADGTLTAQNSITLTGTNPNIVFYQESPLYGLLLNNSISSSFSLSGETGLNAVPYFFDSTTPFTNTTTFQWTLNGQILGDQTDQTIVVAPPNGQSGTSTVTVQASNTAKSFQTANASVEVGFTGQGTE